MLFLVISVFIALGFIIWSISEKDLFFMFQMPLLGAVLIGGAVLLGITAIPKEYSKPEYIEEVTIHSFSKLEGVDKEKGEIYLYKDEDVYTFVIEQNFNIQNEEEKIYKD